MLIAAAVVGGTGMIVRVATTVSVIRAMHIEGGLPLTTMVRGAFFYDPLIAIGLGLAGGGMARRGSHDAYRATSEGVSVDRSRRKKIGWGLFGGGLGVWVLTRVAGLTSCRGHDDCTARVWEAGYYVSLAGTVPGVIIGGYGTGYDRYRRRFGHLSDVRLAPVASRQAWGLALSGRF
jgi:hypothetical protein